jgi:predicted Zn finger-like uncharacterized protein
MLLTCPKCAQKFKVPDKALGTKGRKVKCSNCEHKWHQKPKAKAKKKPVEPAPEAEEAAVEPSEDLGFKVGFGEGEGASGLSPEDLEADMDPPPLGDVSRFRAVRSGPEKPSRPIVLYTLLALLVLIPAALLGLRTTLVHAWPASALLYDTIGMSVAVPGEGLVLQNVHVFRRQEGTVEVLVVNGQVRNPGEGLVSMPSLRATILDAGGGTLASWLFTPETYQLLPGETAPFTSEFANTAAGAERVNVTFSDERPSTGLGY